MTPPPDAARGAGQAIEQVSSRVVYDNPWMTFREDVIRRPDGSEGIYSYVEKPDFALIIPVDRDGFHLVEQYRYPVGHRPGSSPRARCPTEQTESRPNWRDGNWQRKPACGLAGCTTWATSTRRRA